MARSSHGLQFTYRGGGIGGRGGGGGKKASWRIPPEDFVAVGSCSCLMVKRKSYHFYF